MSTRITSRDWVFWPGGTIRAFQESGCLGKLPEGIFREIHGDQGFSLGDIQVEPFRISHDAAEPVGYRFNQGEHSVGIATDLGTYDDYIVEKLTGLSVLLLEANHDVRMLQVGSYPYYLKQRILSERGHLSNETAGQLL